jgi:MFS family permease
LSASASSSLPDLSRQTRYSARPEVTSPRLPVSTRHHTLAPDTHSFTVAKDPQLYYSIAKDPARVITSQLVSLTDEENEAILLERNSPWDGKMFVVILTVSLASFLQGFVQSSVNTSGSYRDQWGLGVEHGNDADTDYRFGAANASPYLFAAVLGCPLAFPINYYLGRRLAIAIATALVLVSSLASIAVRSWLAMFLIRALHGVGMGIKAVSTTVLASEASVGFFRGTNLLNWQMWTAFGIFIGLAFNFLFSTAKERSVISGLVLGAPSVPALALLVALWFCPESPRYLLRPGPNYSPTRALEVLCRLRRTRVGISSFRLPVDR